MSEAYLYLLQLDTLVHENEKTKDILRFLLNRTISSYTNHDFMDIFYKSTFSEFKTVFELEERFRVYIHNNPDVFYFTENRPTIHDEDQKIHFLLDKNFVFKQHRHPIEIYLEGHIYNIKNILIKILEYYDSRNILKNVLPYFLKYEKNGFSHFQQELIFLAISDHFLETKINKSDDLSEFLKIINDIYMKRKYL
jgi:hypothetical protein